MDVNAITSFVVALAVVGAALIGFNSLVAKGPRGTLWLLAASVFTWSSMLPFALRNPDDLSLTTGQDLLVSVLRLCAAVGVVVAIFDFFQKRSSHESHPVADLVLHQPAVWGLIIGINFFALIYQGAISNWLVTRYCASHPIEIIEMTVFFAGLSALALRFTDIAGQFSSLKLWLLPPIPAGGNTVGDCDFLIQQLETHKPLSHTFLLRRIRDALDFVRRTGSADALEPHLRHLEEVDSMRANNAYSMVRIIIWAIPILGLLGTVIGITIAVANLNPEALEESTKKVTHGLGMAFDHTATALSLTMLLMFTKAAVERLEDNLLGKVDERVSHEMIGRFQVTGDNSDPNVAAIHRMADQVVVAIESLAGRQADIWKNTIDGAHQQWADVTVAAARSFRDSLDTVVQEGLERHATTINQGGERIAGLLIQGAQLHAKTVCDASERYAQAMVEATEQHTNKLAQATQLHANAITQVTQQHAHVISEGTQQHFERLVASTSQHAEQLDRSTQQTSERLHEGLEKLAELLIEALERHGEVMTQTENQLAAENRQHFSSVATALTDAATSTAERQERLISQSEHLLKEIQIALVEAASATVEQQEQLIRQSDVLLKVVDATGQIRDLEESLSRNLSAVQKAHNFEEMALSLSAAIQLLSARLGHPASVRPREVAGRDASQAA